MNRSYLGLRSNGPPQVVILMWPISPLSQSVSIQCGPPTLIGFLFALVPNEYINGTANRAGRGGDTSDEVRETLGPVSWPYLTEISCGLEYVLVF